MAFKKTKNLIDHCLKIVDYDTQKPIPKEPKNLRHLNPNTSHFIFVDDGSQNEYSVEIDLRTAIETELKTKENIPLVLIVLEGGPNTLVTIRNALEKENPVILLYVIINQN